MRAGEAFGEIALLYGGKRTANAFALQTSTLILTSRSRFQSIPDRNSAVVRALVKGLCGRLRETTDQLEAIALLPLDQRLARLLRQLVEAADLSGRHAILAQDISRGEMTKLVGGSRPKVNQLPVAWHAAGVAKRTPQALLLDTARLSSVIDGGDES